MHVTALVEERFSLGAGRQIRLCFGTGQVQEGGERAAEARWKGRTEARSWSRLTGVAETKTSSLTRIQV